MLQQARPTILIPLSALAALRPLLLITVSIPHYPIPNDCSLAQELLSDSAINKSDIALFGYHFAVCINGTRPTLIPILEQAGFQS